MPSTSRLPLGRDYRDVVAPGWVRILRPDQIHGRMTRYSPDGDTWTAIDWTRRKEFRQWTETLEPGHYPIPKDFFTREPEMTDDYTALLNCLAYPPDITLDLDLSDLEPSEGWAYDEGLVVGPIRGGSESWITPDGQHVRMAMEYLDSSLPFGVVRIPCYHGGIRRFVQICSPETYSRYGFNPLEGVVYALAGVEDAERGVPVQGLRAWADSLLPGLHEIPERFAPTSR